MWLLRSSLVKSQTNACTRVSAYSLCDCKKKDTHHQVGNGDGLRSGRSYMHTSSRQVCTNILECAMCRESMQGLGREEDIGTTVCQMSCCVFNSRKKARVFLGQSLLAENHCQGVTTQLPCLCWILGWCLQRCPLNETRQARINSFVLFLGDRISDHPLQLHFSAGSHI